MLAACAGLVALACGADDTSSGSGDSSATTRELDISGEGATTTTQAGEVVLLDEPQVSPLPAGTYRTDIFEPAFTFTVADGLHLVYQAEFRIELSRSTTVLDPSEFGMSVERLEGYSIPDDPLVPWGEEPAALPLPDDVVGWLTEREHVETSPPEPVEVGGLEGSTFTYQVGDLPDGTCPLSDCLVFLLPPDWEWSVHDEHDAGRMWILESDDGPLLIDAFVAAGEDVEAFLATADQIVDSIEFG